MKVGVGPSENEKKEKIFLTERCLYLNLFNVNNYALASTVLGTSGAFCVKKSLFLKIFAKAFVNLVDCFENRTTVFLAKFCKF